MGIILSHGPHLPSGASSFLQVLVPVLPGGGLLYRHGVALSAVLLPELAGDLPAPLVGVQAQDDTLNPRMLPQVRPQGAVVQPAKGHGVDGPPMEREIAHKVDGRLKHPDPLGGGIIRDREADILLAAAHISPEALPVPVIGAPQSGVSRLAGAIPAHEHAVVVDGVLVEEPALQETADHLQRDAPLAEVGKDPAVICISRRQGERLWQLILLGLRLRPDGRTPRLPAEGQLLSRSSSTKVQAFRLGSALGMQFHLEVCGSLLDEWLDEPSMVKDLKAAGGSKSQLREQFAQYDQLLQPLAEQVFSGFAARCNSYAQTLNK